MNEIKYSIIRIYCNEKQCVVPVYEQTTWHDIDSL